MTNMEEKIDLGGDLRRSGIINFDIEIIKDAIKGITSVPIRAELALEGEGEEEVFKEISKYIDWLVEKMKDPFGKIIVGKGDSEEVLSFALGKNVGKIGSYELNELEDAGKKFENALISQLIYKINANNAMGVANHVVDNLGKIMFGATFDPGNTLALEYTGNSTGQQGFGLFIEEFMFGAFGAMGKNPGNKRTDPTHDLGKLNTEIKTTLGYNNVIQDVNIGTAHFKLGGKIEEKLGKSPGSNGLYGLTAEDVNTYVLTAVITTYRVAKKMSNFILIRNIFHKNKTTFSRFGDLYRVGDVFGEVLPYSPTTNQKKNPNYNESDWAANLKMTDMGGFLISNMFLFMGLLVYELWKEVLKDMTIPNTVNNRSLIDVKWDIKKNKKNGLVLGLVTSFRSNPEKGIEASLEAYKFEKLYARRIDLLNMARGGSKAFRSALFSMVRYRDDWMRIP